uniref:Uncharacterized protein n=1 Tax=Ditylenchus dipsaci TaxID=166011 RepID=A0A915E3Z5_9BILA
MQSKNQKDSLDNYRNHTMAFAFDGFRRQPNSEPNDDKRNRRSHHLYTPLKTSEAISNGCFWNGTLVTENSEWHSEKCVLCKCQAEKVWCTSIKNCFD